MFNLHMVLSSVMKSRSCWPTSSSQGSEPSFVSILPISHLAAILVTLKKLYVKPDCQFIFYNGLLFQWVVSVSIIQYIYHSFYYYKILEETDFVFQRMLGE